ncbi:hypothetical protein D8L93_08785 [Sodalis-like symbiont of Bactericera trigonica]|nr:hypothetical protein D8L93_08785 [Sodalis-like symbiont of Bactericera trigonica]
MLFPVEQPLPQQATSLSPSSINLNAQYFTR